MSNLKDQAMKTANKVLGSAPAAGLLSHPKLQDVVRRVINLRSDVRDALDDRVATIARRFDLVTQKELKHHKRMVRELENQVASLEHELAQQRRRAERAESALDKAKKDATAAAKATGAAEAKAEATEKKAPAAKKAPAKKAAKKRTTRAKKADATGAADKKPTRSRATAKRTKKAAKKEAPSS